jgi:hypothetical protein
LKWRANLGASLILDMGYGEIDDSLLAACQAGVGLWLAPDTGPGLSLVQKKSL